MNREGKVLRRQVEIDGLGKILLVRTTKEVAQAQSDPAQLTDVGLKNLLFVNRKIGRFNETESAIYRITITGDPMPQTALVQDDRQEIREVKDSTIELHVKAIRVPPAEGDEKPKEEFLKSCHYIDCDNRRVQALAKLAVGDETDPWKKATQIEGWVHRNMQIDPTVPVAPAGQIAEKLRGDCRQYAMLTAAMCRAAGVPSRTAIGLVYGEDRQGRPMFGFHMWAEVWVRGRWLGLDATLGNGSVGAAHIKVTDHSWHNTQSLTPLLPLQRVLGKMKIEVVRVEH
jgi:transglutaminase-like putative cysteine protease